jgi:hypothetical protein
MNNETTVGLFDKWWMGEGPASSADNSELLARKAWDSAILTAASILDSEKDRLIRAQQYHEAAATRDARRLVESAFTRPHMLCPLCGHYLCKSPGCRTILSQMK